MTKRTKRREAPPHVGNIKAVRISATDTQGLRHNVKVMRQEAFRLSVSSCEDDRRKADELYGESGRLLQEALRRGE
jgi:hypothetical protein